MSSTSSSDGSFPVPGSAENYPLILTIEQASRMLQVPIGTIRDWRSRGLLGDCCNRRGKHLRFHRDRLLAWCFDD